MKRSSALRARLDRRLGPEFSGLSGDSLYTGVMLGTNSLVSLIQVVIITHALGLHDYGRFALVVAFVVLVGQFFDVRVGAAATVFGARWLQRSIRGAAGIFQFTYLIDVVTGIAGFVVVVALAPFVGPPLIGGGGTALIILYAGTLLASTANNSSIAILRLFDRFRLIAVYSVALEAARVALLVAAVTAFDDLTSVVCALLAYEVLLAVVNTFFATRAFFQESGGLRLTSLALSEAREDWRPMLGMVFHTNVLAYGRIAQVQLPILLIGAIVGATETGIYKVASTAAALLGAVTAPAAAAIPQRLAKLLAVDRRREAYALVRQATLVFAPVMGVILAGVILLRSPFLELVGGANIVGSTGPALILLGAAQAINGILFWNVAALLAAGRSRLVAATALVSAAIQFGLLPPLIIHSGATGAAIAFLVSNVATNVWAAWAALRVLSSPGEPLEPPDPATAVAGASNGTSLLPPDP